MKHKKLIITVAMAVLAIAAVIAIVVISNGNSKNDVSPEVEKSVCEDIAGKVEVDASVNGISVCGAQNISGIFVEDGSDEVMDKIFTVDFSNDSDYYLQYAEIVLVIDGEEYNFDISTLPASGVLRAMEKNKKPLPAKCESCEMRCINISWFPDEPEMHSDELEITEQDGGIIVKNISGRTINAPIYVYYKNYIDNCYVGGITYRASVKEALQAGQAAAISSAHFAPTSSQIMFVDYAG